ncbi:aldo/keto reductase [Klenkia sp. PcliD-1-E]|uniref:aldo/keto reductase n=1 Tax=Klenkia sp. PcliD-1-E TaxID=2954492 RepID=UPI00209691C1|nr:aldo/keto reductase [Klenkia sp. PcliD-1-E]MCO7220221.1 aldo/keto reductase [Klenkia sp. PcliD-1-E]
MTDRPEVVLGTAQLFGKADDGASAAVLAAGWDAGVRRFDTAPSYGGGRTESQLGEFLAGRDGVEVVATKVGLAPALGTRQGGRQLVAVARAVLPAAVIDRLRRSSQGRARGRFEPAAVRSSLDRSLAQLGGRVDRLLLHEVQPAEVTPELVGVLQRAVLTGEVGAVGVATSNELTAAALAAGQGVFTVAQFAVGPLAPPVRLPASVTVRVGHGLLGPAGEHLQRVVLALGSDPLLARRWAEVTGAPATPATVAAALLDRGPSTPVTDVVVASVDPARLVSAVQAVRGRAPAPAALRDVLSDAVHAAAGRVRS